MNPPRHRARAGAPPTPESSPATLVAGVRCTVVTAVVTAVTGTVTVTITITITVTSAGVLTTGTVTSLIAARSRFDGAGIAVHQHDGDERQVVVERRRQFPQLPGEGTVAHDGAHGAVGCRQASTQCLPDATTGHLQ